jgi:hypothetical protein
VPAAAPLARQLLARFVPEVLRVEQEAVEIEDDRANRFWSIQADYSTLS